MDWTKIGWTKTDRTKMNWTKSRSTDFATKFLYRLIFAAYNWATENISEMLINILDPISHSLFTVQNSAWFVNEIRGSENRFNGVVWCQRFVYQYSSKRNMHQLFLLKEYWYTNLWYQTTPLKQFLMVLIRLCPRNFSVTY